MLFPLKNLILDKILNFGYTSLWSQNQDTIIRKAYV